MTNPERASELMREMEEWQVWERQIRDLEFQRLGMTVTRPRLLSLVAGTTVPMPKERNGQRG